MKYLLQEMPDMRHTGERRVYPKAVNSGLISTQELIKMMQTHNHALAPSVAQAVLSDVAHAVACLLAQGHSVGLDGIGTLSVALSFDGGKAAETVSADGTMSHRHVGVKGVNLKASPTLLARLQAIAKPVRANGGVRALKSGLGSRDERMERGRQIAASRGFVTLSAYAQTNHLSRSVAWAELQATANDPSLPLRPVGRGSHRVWVARQADTE